jgi:hypothetical protein
LKNTIAKFENNLGKELKMAARHWTDEQKAAQSLAIQAWKPWKKSTGPITQQGKVTVAMNACQGYFRERARFGQWLLNARNTTDSLTPELFGNVAMRCKPLGMGLSTSIDHEQFFVDMALANTVAAMALEPNKIVYFYYRALIIDAAMQIVLPSRI